MLRSLAHSGVKHTLSTPSLRAAAAAAPIPVVSAGHARSLVSTVLLTADNYESKQVVELRAMLRQRGLTTGGRKAELVQRLKQSDMQRAGSTLATGAKAPRRGRAAAKSKPEIEAKVAEEVASMPHTPAEKVHHEVSSFSMDRDGTRQGFDLPLTRAIADSVPVPVVASGGVGNLDHLVDGVREGHATGVLAASIFHFGEFTIRQAKDHMVRAGLPMRLDP